MRSRLLKALSVLLALLILGYSGASWYIASGVTKAKRTTLEAFPESVGLPYEKVGFNSKGGGIILSGWYIPHPSAKATVIIVHGVDSNRASTSIGILEIAKALYDNGYGLFLFDLRGHGLSGGTRFSGGYFEQRDLLGAYDFLVGAGVPPNRIAYLGFSLGGAISLLTASQQGSVPAVVADSSFADISDLIAEEVPKRSPAPRWAVPALLPGTIVAARLVYGIDIRSISPEKAIAKYPNPVLLIHGLKDERIPIQHAQRLEAASPHPDTQLWLVPSAEHTRAFKSQPQEYIQHLVSYLNSRFPQTQR